MFVVPTAHQCEQIAKLFTANIIIDKYSWLPVTATVHKILVHASDILENTTHMSVNLERRVLRPGINSIDWIDYNMRIKAVEAEI